MRTGRTARAVGAGMMAATLLTGPAVGADEAETLDADQRRDAVWVEGSGPWRILLDEGTTTMTPDGIVRVRDAVWTGRRTMSDRRLSGTWIATLGSDDYGPEDVYGLDVFWATLRIENEGGAWQGVATGVTDPDGFSTETAWLVGEDGYAGLSAYLRTAWPRSPVVGMIFPGQPPPGS